MQVVVAKSNLHTMKMARKCFAM